MDVLIAKCDNLQVRVGVAWRMADDGSEQLLCEAADVA